MILPTQAALERVPGNLVEASGDLGADPRQTFRHVLFPLALPGIVAGSIFTFSLTMGDYIIPQIVGTRASSSARPSMPSRAPPATFPLLLPSRSCRSSSWAFISPSPNAWGPSMHSDRSQSAGFGLKFAAGLGLAFLHLPILLIFVYAFTQRKRVPVAATGLHASVVRRRLEPPGHLGSADAVGQGLRASQR